MLDPSPRMPDTRVRGVRATLARAWLKLRYQVLGGRYDRLVLERLEGVPLLILPQVFNPVLLRSGAIMARALARLRLDDTGTVLDLGTGSGIGAVFAGLRGLSVMAADINPEAVRCARINALLNGVDERVEVRLGDLFEPVAGERFDLVLFNPPFYRGAAADNLDFAWRGEDVFERFAAGLGAMLTPGGYALVILSTDGDGNQLLAELAGRGFRSEVFERTDLINEVVTIYAVRRAPAPPDGSDES